MSPKTLKKFIYLIIISVMINSLVGSSFNLASATTQSMPPAPPCEEYTINEKEVLNDVLNSPQMTSFSDWELIEYKFSKCATYGVFVLNLKYTLPKNFSRLGLRYVSHFPGIRLSVESKKPKESSLDLYNRLATEAKTAIQNAENNNRIKEFINKVGVEESTFENGVIKYRNSSAKSYIYYTYYNQKVWRYRVPTNMVWQNYPEIPRFKSVFQQEVPNENCSLEFPDGTISSWRGEDKGKMLWRFNETIKGAGCPSWILAEIYDDGTYKAQVDPTVPKPGCASKNKVIINKKSKDLYSVELIIQDYTLGSDNVPRIFDICVVEDGKEYYVIDPDKDGNFGTKRDYTKKSDIEGIHINVRGEKCEPVRQNLSLTLMTKEKRYYQISKLEIGSVEDIENIWIDHAPEGICYDCPGWKPDPNYCQDYETFSERPKEKIIVEHSCGKTPDYCYGIVTMRPFLYSPVDKRLRIIKKMSFNINISEEELKVKSAAEVSAMLIEQKQLSSVQSIQFKHEEEKPTYEVVGVRKAKLLFFIPISLKIRLEVNAVTGQIMTIKKPWWSFLVF